MKKIISLLFLLFCITGCVQNNAKEPVKEYLNKYRNHNAEVTNALNELLKQENLSEEQNELYLLIMKKQYTELEYKIKEETYNGNKAIITVEITVFDYQHSKEEAKRKMLEKEKEYIRNDGTLNKEKYMNLQLKYMKEETKRVKYTIDFNVNLQNDTWVLETPDYKVIEKIHGLYNYQEED